MKIFWAILFGLDLNYMINDIMNGNYSYAAFSFFATLCAAHLFLSSGVKNGKR
jgi:hypothetical protein